MYGKYRVFLWHFINFIPSLEPYIFYLIYLLCFKSEKIQDCQHEIECDFYLILGWVELKCVSSNVMYTFKGILKTTEIISIKCI